MENISNISVDEKDYFIVEKRRLWVHKDVDPKSINIKSSHIYIFTKASDYINKGIIKIGETGSGSFGERSVKDRVYEQPNSTDTEPLLLLFTLDCKKYIDKGLIKSALELEQYLHSFFREKQWLDGAGTEWFKVSLDEVIKTIRVKLTDDSISLITFKPHFLQEVAMCQLLDAIQNGGDTINLLSELCARFGKTLTYLELFRRLENDIMILPSFVHSVFTSFRKEIEGPFRDENLGKWTNFKGFKVIDTRTDGNDQDWQDKFNQNLGKSKLVVLVSVQTRIDSFKKFDCIRKVDPARKFFVVDEADFGAHTTNSQKVIDYLN
jgi:hypothetical protein